MMRYPYIARPYQHLMTNHVIETERCAIWAGMGLGKSIATLTAIDHLITAGEEQPVLILAPLRVAKSVWPAESRKWGHLRHISVIAVVGSEQERRRALNHDASVFACNYDNLPWLIEHYGERWPFATVVSDESTRLKSFRLRQGGVRAQMLARVAHTKVKRFIQLTGTPSPNGLKDLWGQAWFLDKGVRLGRTMEAFKQRWFQRSFDGYSLDPLPFAQEQIQDKLRDICLAIDAKDWFDLKAPIVNNIYVDLPAKARQLYKDMEKRMFMEIEEHPIEAFNAAARTIKCLQIANGAAYTDELGNWKEIHNAKIEALESVVEEANGAPVLVAYHFKSDLARLQRAFPQARALDTSPATITAWNAGKIPLLLAHPASAGHGINLQDGGNIIAFFGHWWDLEQYQQIIERIGPVRQAQSGYDRPVFIHHIIARDTVDEMVMARRESKREVQDILLRAMKARKGT